MSEITLYSFEDARGVSDGYTTMDATEARERGEKYSMRVIANLYEWQDDETAWDFTGVDLVDEPDDYPCFKKTKRYCAGHGCGNPSSEPCEE